MIIFRPSVYSILLLKRTRKRGYTIHNLSNYLSDAAFPLSYCGPLIILYFGADGSGTHDYGLNNGLKLLSGNIGLIFLAASDRPVADPGFPRREVWGGGRNPWFWSENLLFCKVFCRKLYENEKSLTERRWASLDPPMQAVTKIVTKRAKFRYIWTRLKLWQSSEFWPGWQ